MEWTDEVNAQLSSRGHVVSVDWNHYQSKLNLFTLMIIFYVTF